MKNHDLLSQALQLHQAGNLEAALPLYETCCNEQPDNPDVWRLRGGTLSGLGREDEACGFFRESIVAAQKVMNVADLNFYRIDFASSLCRTGQYPQASEVYQAILQDDPQNHQAHFGMGRVYENFNQFTEALDHYRKACNQTPADLPALLGIGVCCNNLQQKELASEAFSKALEYDPNSARAWLGLGMCQQRNQLHKAREYIGKALEIAPEFAQALDAMAYILLKEGKPAQALDFSSHALQNENRDGEILCTAALIQRELGEADLACRLLIGANTLISDNPQHLDQLLLTIQYASDIPPEKIFKLHRQWAKRFEKKPPEIEFLTPSKPADQTRLRIGFVSGDFCSHPISFFLEPLLPFFCNNDCEVYLYSNTVYEDETTNRLKEKCTVWRDIRKITDHEAAQQVAADQIDALIDLSGHTPDNRLGIFPYRPARKQFTWLGYPDTTGMNCIDYRIVDEITDPPGAEQLSSEKLLRMPGCFLDYTFPEGFTPPPLKQPEAGQPFIFGCFNNPAKFSPECLKAWAQILQKCPNSRLLLKASGMDDELTRRFWENKLSRCGINPARLILRGKTASLQDHFNMYGEVDLALDTFPYNGTTTTFEALCCGVPVVTMCGARHTSKTGSSILTYLGHENFITNSTQAYIQTTINITNNPDKFASEKIKANQHMSTLHSDKSHAEKFTDTFKSLIIKELDI